MKRKILGGLAILSAALMPFSGVSAANSVDYEKSVGQVEGADTINWVVEATDDGGYVIGGQTIGCYKVDLDDLKPMSAQPKSGGLKSMSIPNYAQKATYEECVEYYEAQKSESIDNANDADLNSYESFLLDTCLKSNSVLELSGGSGLTSMVLSDDYEYSFTCIDYIAKFKKDGTKEWLTTVEDESRPTAVKKINDGSYRMFTEAGYLYTFNSKGVAGISKDTGYYPERGTKSYFNDDGSMVLTGDGLHLLKSDGTLGKSIESTDNDSYWDVLPNGDNYVVNKCTNTENSSTCVVADVAKDLSSIKERTLTGISDGIGVRLYSANDNGDVLVGYGDKTKYTLASFDKDGKLIAEINDVDKIVSENDIVFAYKDFTIGIASEDSFVGVAQKIIKFDRDLSIKYEYSGDGHEYMADVSELLDGSLVGVGLAQKDSSKISVTGDVNGGYLRLVAQDEKPTTPTTRPNVKNPKTWDAVDTIATIGGIALLGLGVFLRKSLNRR